MNYAPQAAVIPQDDKQAVAAETRAVWTNFHQALHPSTTLEKALQNPLFKQILLSHAMLNLKYKHGGVNAH